MKLFYILIILIFFQNCSFDNKTGIWKNENNITKNENEIFSEFKKLSSSNEPYNVILPIQKGVKFNLTSQINNFAWTDIFYNKSNNLDNFYYNDLNRLIFKSKKITKFKIKNYLLFEENNVILSDQRGNIIIFSLNNNKIINKFNFYKKKYKKFNKILNLIVENNVIYISDNLGYLYAFDYLENKILWAKNYKIPFGSNIKISKNKLIAANQNNNLYFFDKTNGDIIKFIPTEETTFKNEFINNLSLDNENSFFLNTYGSLYSIDNKNLKINWFLNLNQSLDLNPSNLFSGNQIINNRNKIVITSDKSTYILNADDGSIIHKKNFTSLVKPLMINDHLFLISKNNLLICMDIVSGNIIYSYDINEKIADFINTKKRKVEFKEIVMVNSKIFIFLKNSYVLKFNVDGNLEEVVKLPAKMQTYPIFVDNSLIFTDYKNKIHIVN
ncbi:hypothetical protein OAR89_02960 [Pelagibacteraceae bacterium]|jgi:outer membrane protein assembly factor BamB|nr:hypothetical protein [Pelagibacteraceae bacterium]